ncbi:MAG TPA: septal ring lytic transglycosylase RlpA family protein, partial [Hyphomonadaceae bacterium]|nr:septal ring lytic transglycosylase RlpA family protein [Hyphomonadaceae bacterium]
TLPLNSLVQVTNLENGREVIVRVTDRGPFVGARLIDLSHGAATVLGFARAGGAQVHVRYLGPAPRRVNASGASAAPGEPAAPQAQAPSPLNPEPLPAETSMRGLYVQVGAFADMDNAQRVRRAAEAAGPVSVDVRASASGGEVHRVRVGPFATREEAEAAQATLSNLGYYDAALVTR